MPRTAFDPLRSLGTTEANCAFWLRNLVGRDVFLGGQ
jgi:hypothetical protein